MRRRPLMIDLFAGMGGASASFRDAGWEVVRVELDPVHEAEVHADVREWSWRGRRPARVWASPPCTEFSRDHLPWLRGKYPPPSLGLVGAAERVIRECDPDWWVIENVRGASRYLSPRFGPPRTYGPVFLWGRFPEFRARVGKWKERLPSTRRAERAMIPRAVSDGLRKAIEADLFFVCRR